MGKHFALNKLVGQMQIAISVILYQPLVILGLTRIPLTLLLRVGNAAILSRTIFKPTSLTLHKFKGAIHQTDNAMLLGF
tara:strand:- start:1188 stop:1424 length:237 start_codon:yes stop_codon:yes gene_type:complete